MIRYFAMAAAAGAMVWGAYDSWPWWGVSTPPGVLAPDEPQQTETPPRELPAIADWRLTAVADYTLTARILSTHRYSDRGQALVPVDIAVGWGRMSDREVLDRLKISQNSRYFFYEWRGTPPIPQPEMQSHAANMHLIAANSDLAWRIRRLRSGTVATFSGQLVNARGQHGETWNSSLSRTDGGPGACELFYVDALSGDAR